jgi:hypothetical protein
MKKINSSRKALGPIVATILLISVAVTSFVIFENWYHSYETGLFSSLQKENIDNVEVLKLYNGILYVKNQNSENVSIKDVKIDSKSCGVSFNLTPDSINSINLTNCSNNFPTGVREITLITNIGVYSKVLYFKPVSFIPSNSSTITTGNFVGYAWGEQFGYISFNGTNYGVSMKNNQLYGYAYSENLGYISFNGTNYNVSVKDGVLVGYAYGENIGYIHFNSSLYQTTFNGTNLNGYAYSENYGYIHFNLSDVYNVSLNN